MSASKPEPPPTRSPESQPFVEEYIQLLRGVNNPDLHRMADLIDERRQFGVTKYGTELHTFNGRDAIEDARQEFGDLVVYLRQAFLEGREEEVDELIEFIRRFL